MLPILIATKHHGLLPLAWALHGEDHEFQLVTRKQNYERAGFGMFERQLRARNAPREIGPLQEIAAEGHAIVATDCPWYQKHLASAPRLFGFQKSEGRPGGMALGGWRNPNGPVENLHLLVRDVGAWPGGMGPAVVASAGAFWLNSKFAFAGAEGLLEGLDLPAGLFRIGFDIETLEEGGGLVVRKWVSTGWDPHHLHLWLSAFPGRVGELLNGASVKADGHYTLAMAVSVPPWPNQAPEPPPRRTIGLDHLSKPQRRQIGWHDVCRDEDRVVQTCGLDGMVGWVRATSNRWGEVKDSVQGVAEAIEVDEKQFRPDAGVGFKAAIQRLHGLELLKEVKDDAE